MRAKNIYTRVKPIFIIQPLVPNYMKNVTHYSAILSIMLFSIFGFSFCFNSIPLKAQQTKLKVFKVKSADSVKVSSDAKIRVLTANADNQWMDDINPDDIESVDVIKKNGKGVVKITLKNGKVVEQEVNDAQSATKNKVMTVVFNEEDSQSNYMNWEELEGINPDDIESVDVIKKDGDQGRIKVTLKNGEVIEKELESKNGLKGSFISKTVKIMDEEELDLDAIDGRVFVYETLVTDDDDIMKLEAFKHLDKKDVKEIMVKVKDDVKTITVTTNEGEVIEEIVAMEKGKGAKMHSFNLNGANSSKMNWVRRGSDANTVVEIQRSTQDQKMEALEERLERMEEKIDALLEALNKDKSKSTKKKKG